MDFALNYLQRLICHEIQPTNHSINNLDFCKVAIGRTIFSCTFFKDLISDGSFPVPEHCQHYFLYWPLRLKVFLYRESVCFHSFSPRLIVTNPCVGNV